MAYDHNKHEVRLADGGVTTSTGELGVFTPGYVPHIVRAVSAVVTVASATTTNTVLSIRKQDAGSTATTDRTVIDTITVPAATAAGQVLYVDGLNQEIAPGEELQVVITTASTTTGNLTCKALVEQRHEIPANNTDMTESA